MLLITVSATLKVLDIYFCSVAKQSLTLCDPVVCSLPYKGLRNALRGIKLLQLPLEMKSSMKAYSVCQHHAQAWHSSCACLLNTYYVAGTVLGSEDTAVKKTDFVPALLEGSV